GGAGDLALMPAARASDPARADLAAIADEPTQSGDVLVVHLRDLLAAVRARLAARGRRRTLSISPANRPSTLLCHPRSPNSDLDPAPRPAMLRVLARRPQNGMSSSDAAVPTEAVSKSSVAIGTSLSVGRTPLENPFPPPASSRPPRNWTESAMISMDSRFCPSFSQVLHSKRPSIATGRPFLRY